MIKEVKTMNEPQVRVGVGTFVVKNGRFLIMKRHGSHGEGTWALPGGHMEFGETVTQTTVREIKEETDLEVFGTIDVGFTNDIFTKEGKHYITVFSLSYTKGTPKIMEPHKCIEMKWVARLEDIPEPQFIPLKNLVNTTFADNINQLVKASKRSES
jgi:8-oxo-dGTP diphosphatase